MKTLLGILISLCMCISITSAQIPRLLTQQGFVADSTGAPLNGLFPMAFRIYTDTTAGTLMLTSSYPGIAISAGAYSVVIDVSTIEFTAQYWLETEVNGQTLSPRTRLTSAPYSLNSLSLLGPNSNATGTNAIAGGSYNNARGANSVVVGGGGSVVDSNSALGNYNFIGGGRDNLTNTSTTAVVGGQANQATNNFAAIVGGTGNTASGQRAFVGGGNNNIASGEEAVVAGGDDNVSSGNESVVAGGNDNTASGENATVSGGQSNKARGQFSAIAGGGGVSPSDSNSALGDYSFVGGGRSNVAKGEYSFAAGRNAKANYQGNFVWNSSSSSFSSTDTAQFLINASGGVGIGADSPIVPLHVKTSSSIFSSKAAVLRLEAASAFLGSANAAVVFNTGTGTNETWSIGLDDGDDNFKISRNDSVGEDNTWLGISTDGELEMFKANKTKTIILDPEEAGGGADIGLKNSSGTTTISLDADAGDGAEVYLYNSLGSYTIEIDADETDAAALRMRDADNTTTVEILTAESATNGAQIQLRKADGTSTITLDAEYGEGGTGRVTTPVLQITGGSDLAEPFEITNNEVLPAGSVVVIDENNPGKLTLSNNAYDNRVAGVISGAGGINPGIMLTQSDVFQGGQNVAISGRVYCLADASSGSIKPGDLLTSSNTPGHAMKASDRERAHGTVIGKAMTSLKEGKGLVLVLVNLQ